ncbi:uncharacterized protein BXZ73DRAFT_87502 [Epithele typhae]|uniref:uncharacterized protein n=1 Tax=Epithele typhae TaxID=378194 RepID=UPI0020080F4B|nr:uncharacterized protein BXZ73DRAFT_87502 [Epithele typhae]KAH9943081.1 hypothetical protein BXZ73DRAFT_87502 [Epithele typhae]
MSSITFPYAAHAASSSFVSVHSDLASSYDPPSDTSSFQMNPLSSHPPRTPRTSIMSSASHVYASDYESSKEDATQLGEREPEADGYHTEDEEDEAKAAAAKSRVRKEEVWREVLKTAYGRDKAFKLIQYSMKMYLLFHVALASSAAFKGRSRPGWETELTKRLTSAIAGFSLTRKCLILFNWLPPLTAILEQHASDPYAARGARKGQRKPLLHTILHAPPPVLLELLNGLADDAATLSRLGLLGPRAGERAGKLANWCWFAGTLVNLVENSVERSVILELQHQVEGRLYDESMAGTTAKSNPAADKLDHKELARLQKQDYWIQISKWKLVMDLIFVSYDVFRLKRAKGQVQTAAGLASAILSSMKYYDKHKSALSKAVSS